METKMSEGELKKKLDKLLEYPHFTIIGQAGVVQIVEEMKADLLKLCEGCELQDWACNQSKECPRTQRIKKWLGTNEAEKSELETV